jgi:hypothetical protein
VVRFKPVTVTIDVIYKDGSKDTKYVRAYIRPPMSEEVKADIVKELSEDVVEYFIHNPYPHLPLAMFVFP